MATTVFGVKIFINDHMLVGTEDSAVGYYNNTSLMTANANSAQKNVTVADGTKFEEKQIICIGDSAHTEENTINTIAGNVLTMFNNLAYNYTTANSGYVNANSCFKWSQNLISGVSGWQYSILAANGIGEITKYVDLKRGGNVENQSTGEIRIKNTSLFQEWLLGRSVTLNNAECRFYEFSNTTPTLIYKGICEEPTYDSVTYKIKVKGYYNKRIASLAVKTADDIAYPVSFGKFLSAYDTSGNPVSLNYAKVVRTAKSETYYNTDQTTDLAPIPAHNTLFLVETSWPVPADGIHYQIRVADSMNGSGSDIGADINGKWLFIVEGTNKGSYRKIVSTDWSSDSGYIRVTIDNYFESLLTSSTWLKIVDVERTYKLDNWDCYGFIDEAGALINTTYPSLYVYDSDGPIYLKVPDYAYTTSSTTNTLDIEPKFFDGDPDSLLSFVIYPCSNCELLTATTDWGFVGWNKFRDGLYYTQTIISTTENHIPDATELLNITDGDSTTSANISISLNTGSTAQPAWVGYALEFDLPALPYASFTFDNAYFLTRGAMLAPWTIDGIGVCPTQADHRMLFCVRRFRGGYRALTVKNTKDETTADMDSYQQNLLDEYLNPVGTTNNLYFYTDIAVGGSAKNLTHYEKFEIPSCDSKELYESLVKGMFMWYVQVNTSYRGGGLGWLNSVTIPATTTQPLNMTFYELAVLFKSSYDIGNEVYTLFKGRKFMDTWATRKTSANLIESPIDFLEHVCRLQNWSDRSNEPSGGWGKAYSQGALIKTTGDGSFDDADLNTVKGFAVSRQVTDESDMDSIDLKKTLCKNFNLVSYVDKDGNECVKPMITTAVPTDSITLADIYDRNRISVVDARPSDIFVEPFVRYAYDCAADTYQKTMAITNVAKPTYNSSYVTGFTTAAESYWDKCHALWLVTGSVERPPSELTDLVWCNGTNDDEAAEANIKNWIDLMGRKTIKINLHYNTAKTWELGHEFYLTLPHQTNNVRWKCKVSKKVMSFYSPYIIDLEALMIVSAPV